MKIEPKEFPKYGCNLSIREKKIITDLVGNFLDDSFTIRVDDYYYYSRYFSSYRYNRFDDFNDLKDYVFSNYYMRNNKPAEYIDLLKTSKLDSSFDDNQSIRWALMGLTRIDFCIELVTEYKEMLILLLNDDRIRANIGNIKDYISSIILSPVKKIIYFSKLTDLLFNKYISETS